MLMDEKVKYGINKIFTGKKRSNKHMLRQIADEKKLFFYEFGEILEILDVSFRGKCTKEM